MTLIDLSQYYDPHEGQTEVHNSPASIKVLEIGRRWGKSRCGYGEAVKNFVEAREIEAPSSLIPPWHGWALSPTFPQSRQIWNEAMSLWPSALVHSVSQDERTIYLNGSDKRTYGILEFKSAHDPDSLQTVGLDFLWIQEAQDVSDQAFEKVLPTLRSPGRMGKGIFEGIPSSYASHWFRRISVAAERGREGYEYFHHTAFDNPMLDDYQRAEIEADRDILPDKAWRRMYLAEFNEDAGYFTNISQCIAGEILPGPVPGRQYVAGLDLGRKMDASVFIIMDATDRKVVHHTTWDSGQEWVLQREAIIGRWKEWGFERLIIDATGMGGDMFVSEMVEAGLPVEPFIIGDNRSRTGTRTVLLQSLAVAMERKTISFPSIPSLLRQLRAFQYRKLPGGDFKAEAPSGEHDDEVFALALALTACDEPPGVSVARSYYQSRYVPTQSEMESGTFNSLGSRIMRERKIEKIRERQDALGVR